MRPILSDSLPFSTFVNYYSYLFILFPNLVVFRQGLKTLKYFLITNYLIQDCRVDEHLSTLGTSLYSQLSSRFLMEVSQY